MQNVLERVHALGIADEKGGQVFLADFREVGGVGAVVAADDEEDIHRLFVVVAEHAEEGILALLGGSADGVEYVVIVFASIAIDDC